MGQNHQIFSYNAKPVASQTPCVQVGDPRQFGFTLNANEIAWTAVNIVKAATPSLPEGALQHIFKARRTRSAFSRCKAPKTHSGEICHGSIAL